MDLTIFLKNFVIANLMMFLFISVFIYKNIGEKIFKYYSIYKVFLLCYLLFKSDIYVEVILNKFPSLSSLNWHVQIIYNSYLTYFGLSFIKIDYFFPKANKIIRKLLKYILYIYSFVCIVCIITKANHTYFLFFAYSYLPLQFIISFYIIYLSTKINLRQRVYYLIGLISYILLATLAFYLSVINHLQIGLFTAISFFYLGLLIEEYSFGYGLAILIKNIYVQKINAERNLIAAQKEINKHLQSQVNQIQYEKDLKDLKSVVMNSKMNSHFIFNTLNSIKHYIIQSDKKNAIEYLGKFSKFIRNTLEIEPTKLVSLEKELNNTHIYISIENMRFDNEINFTMDISNTIDVRKIKVPPFLFQPFIENAIWHGVASKKDKQIQLTLNKDKNHLIINIIDNGIGRKQATFISQKKNKYKKSMGIEIIKSILTNFYGNNYDLQFKNLHNSDADTGTIVLIKIPIESTIS